MQKFLFHGQNSRFCPWIRGISATENKWYNYFYYIQNGLYKRGISAFNKLVGQKDAIITALNISLATAFDLSPLKAEQTELESEMSVVSDLIEKCIHENACVALDQNEYQQRYDELTDRFENIKAQYETLEETIRSKQSRKAAVEAFLKTLEKAELLDTFETSLWCGLVDYVTDYSNVDVLFTFKNGQEVRA